MQAGPPKLFTPAAIENLENFPQPCDARVGFLTSQCSEFSVPIWSNQMSIRVLLSSKHKVVSEGIAAVLRTHHDMDLVGIADNALTTNALCGQVEPDVDGDRGPEASHQQTGRTAPGPLPSAALHRAGACVNTLGPHGHGAHSPALLGPEPGKTFDHTHPG